MGGDESPFAGADSIGEIAGILAGLEAGADAGDATDGQAEAPARKARRAAEPVADDDTPADDEQDPDDGTPALDDPDGTAQDDDDQAGESDEAEAEAEADADPVFTVEIDGKDAEVPASELIKGYQRQSDYTRKTTELAEYRKGLDAEHQRLSQAFEGASQAATQRGEQFDALLGALQDLIAPPDFDAIEKAHGFEASARAERNFRKAMEKLEAAKAQRQKLAAEAKADADKLAKEQAEKAQAEAKEAAKQSLSRIDEVIPEWRDRKRLRADVGQIEDYWTSAGGSADVLGQITDPVVWKVLRDATLFHAAKARSAAKASSGQAAPVKTVVKPLKVQRPGGSGQEERKRVASREQVARRNKVLASGKLDDIHAAAMAGLLDI